MAQNKSRMIKMEVTPRESAFLKLCRQVGEGYIEGVGVSEGQPSVLKNTVQRIDLKKPDEIGKILGGEGIAPFVNMESMQT